MYTRESGYELNLFEYGDLGDLVPRFRVLGLDVLSGMLLGFEAYSIYFVRLGRLQWLLVPRV